LSDPRDILAEAYADKVSALGELHLLAGLNNSSAAELCGVSLRTYRRWRRRQAPVTAARRLLAVLAGFVPWAGFAGWWYHRDEGKLYSPRLREGFTAEAIETSFYVAQALEGALLELERLRTSTAENPPTPTPTPGWKNSTRGDYGGMLQCDKAMLQCKTGDSRQLPLFPELTRPRRLSPGYRRPTARRPSRMPWGRPTEDPPDARGVRISWKFGRDAGPERAV